MINTYYRIQGIFKGVEQNGKDSAFELILTPEDYVIEFEVDGKEDCVVGIGSNIENSGTLVRSF